MDNSYKNILLKILEAIEYTDDKDAFVADFMRIISAEALVALVKTLPQEKQLEADKKIAEADGQENFSKAVHEYFTTEQVSHAVDDASQKAITEWLRSLNSTLTVEQRLRLVELAAEMQTLAEASVKK